MCAALCSTLFVGLSMQREGDAAATTDSSPSTLHPSAPFLPSALPISSHSINLPPSLNSSPASLSFAVVPQCGPGAVLPSSAVQDVREAGKKPSDSSFMLSFFVSFFLSLHCTGNSSLYVCACCDTGCGWMMITVTDVLQCLCEDFLADT